MLTQARLRELIHYDPETGVFTHLQTRGRVRAGYIAGNLGNSGYWHVRIDTIRYLAHRLAWLYMTGSWPTFDIDHKDGNRLNNTRENLREATRSQNIANQGPLKSNRLGLKGVRLKRGRYVANICVCGKKKYLGSFPTPEEAHAVYAKAAVDYFGEFARSA